MKVGIIGGGNMGVAYCHALAMKGIVSNRHDLRVVEASADRRALLEREHGLDSSPDPGTAADCDLILLATKPQDFPVAAAALGPSLRSGQLVVSIMAGVTLAGLREALFGHSALVRAMPNTPVQCGKGMTVYVCHPDVTDESHEMARKALSATGAVIRVEREDLLDAATAVSGSGPAYVFYFIENMIAAAMELGFGAAEASLLVKQTFEGALALWAESGKPPSVLREMVTSKGGTTEAALGVLSGGGVGDGIVKAVRRANERAEELGRRAGSAGA